MKRCALVAALVLAFVPSVAFAQDNDEAAQAAMNRGVAAFGRGDTEAALAAYDEAKRLAPRANLPYYYAGEALLKLERYEEAIQNFEQYIAKNPEVSDAPEVKARIERIRREKLPGRVRIEVNVPRVRVTIDGATRAESPPMVVSLKPGRHVVGWTSDGYEPTSKEIVVVGQEETTVSGTLVAKPAPPIVNDVPSPPAESPWRTVGWVTLGVGAATVATAFLLDVTALRRKKDDFEAAAAAGAPDALALQDQARGLRTGVVATYVIGALLAAGGVTILIVSPSEAAKKPVALQPSLQPSGAGASLRVTF